MKKQPASPVLLAGCTQKSEHIPAYSPQCRKKVHPFEKE
jgi:hypothetical protein